MRWASRAFWQSHGCYGLVLREKKGRYRVIGSSKCSETGVEFVRWPYQTSGGLTHYPAKLLASVSLTDTVTKWTVQAHGKRDQWNWLIGRLFKNPSDCWGRLPSSPLCNHRSETHKLSMPLVYISPKRTFLFLTAEKIWLKASFLRFSAKQEGEVKVSFHVRHPLHAWFEPYIPIFVMCPWMLPGLLRVNLSGGGGEGEGGEGGGGNSYAIMVFKRRLEIFVTDFLGRGGLYWITTYN